VAESVQFYAEEHKRWRDIFLGVLGHDLRGPLNALALTVQIICVEEGEPSATTRVLMRGVTRLTSLLDSLLEYSTSNLGVGMALQRIRADLGEECAEEIELLRAAHPVARIDYEVSGDVDGGFFDVSKVREALTNLVSNAVKHGEAAAPTAVRVEGDEQSVRISVKKAGEIPSEEINLLFEPLYQRSTPSLRTDRTHLGLGLFIVRQIARAHGGRCRVPVSGDGSAAWSSCPRLPIRSGRNRPSIESKETKQVASKAFLDVLWLNQPCELKLFWQRKTVLVTGFLHNKRLFVKYSG
jgi:signal transduction histidine kinase